MGKETTTPTSKEKLSPSAQQTLFRDEDQMMVSGRSGVAQISGRNTTLLWSKSISSFHSLTLSSRVKWWVVRFGIDVTRGNETGSDLGNGFV